MNIINHKAISVRAVISLLISCLMVFSFGCARKEVPEIKIGAILPLTGSAAQYGQSAKNAIDLAIHDINMQGGINNKMVKIVYQDDQGDPKSGVNAIQKIANEQIQLIIGAMPSSVTLAIAPVANSKKIILISPTSTASQVREAGIFRVCTSDDIEGSAMVNFLKGHNYKKVAGIFINNDYGVGLRKKFEAGLKSAGIDLVENELFDPGSTDIRAQMIKIKNQKPEGLYIVGYKEQGTIIRQARELGIKIPFWGTTMMEDPEIIHTAGIKNVEGIIYTYRSYNPDSKNKHVGDFVAAYQEKYGIIPDFYAAASYDAAEVAIFAIQKAGYKSEDIRKYLYSIKDFPGVTGSITFDDKGDVDQPMRYKVIKNGNFVDYQ